MAPLDVARYAFEAPPSGWTLVDAQTHHYKCVRPLAEDGIYVGASVVGALYDATYDKTVDNTLANNASMLFAGQRLHSEDSAGHATYAAGVLVRYRGSLGVLFYGIEGDWTTRQGTVSGHLEGVGSTPLRNQVGENWPEDWELAKDKSYGLTLRVGGEVPLIDTTAYVLVGVRRVRADFSRSLRQTGWGSST